MRTRNARETAPEAYARNLAEAKRQIAELTAHLVEHEKRHAADPGNWGLVGDLGSVNDSLLEILGLFSTEEG